ELAECLDRGYLHKHIRVLGDSNQQGLNGTRVPQPCKCRRCRLLEPALVEAGRERDVLKERAQRRDSATITDLAERHDHPLSHTESWSLQGSQQGANSGGILLLAKRICRLRAQIRLRSVG